MSRLPVNQPYVSQASASPSQIASFQRSPSSLFDGGMRLGQSLQRFGAGLHQKEKEKAIKLENARRNKFLAQTTPLMHEIENDFKQQLFHLVNDPDNQGADLQSTARDFTETWIQNIDRIIEGKGSHKKIEGLVDLGHDPDNPFTDSDSWSATGQLDKLKSRLWGTLSASMPTIQKFENHFVKEELYNSIHKNALTGLQSVRANPATIGESLRSSLADVASLPKPDQPDAKKKIISDFNTAFTASATENINGYLSSASLDGLNKEELDTFFALSKGLADSYQSAFKDHDQNPRASFNAQITPIITEFLSEQALTPIDKKGTTVGQYFSRNMDKGVLQALGKQNPSLINLFGFNKLSAAAASGQKQVVTQLNKEINNGIDRIDKAIDLLSAPSSWYSLDNQMAAEELFHKDAATAFQQLKALRSTPGYDVTDDKLGDKLESKFIIMSALLATRSGKSEILVGTPVGRNYTGENWYENTFLKDGQTDSDYFEKISSYVRSSAKEYGFEVDQLTLQHALLDESSGFREALINQYNSRIADYERDPNSFVALELSEYARDKVSKDNGIKLMYLKNEFKDNPTPERYNRLLDHIVKIDSNPLTKKYNLLEANDTWSQDHLAKLMGSDGQPDFEGFKLEVAQASVYGKRYGKFLDDLATTRSESLLKGYPFALKVIGQKSLDNFASSNFDAIDNDTNVSNSWKEVEDAMRGKRLFITGMSFDRGVSNAPDVLDLFNNALFSNPTGNTHYKRRAISSKAKQIAKRWAHVQIKEHKMSANDVANRFADQLSSHRWIISNGSYYPIDFGSKDVPEGGEFQPADFFRFYDESTSLSRDMNTPDYVGEITKRKWGTSLFEVDGHKLWAGNQKLNLVEKIPTFAQKAKGVFDDLFGSEKTFLTESLERETRWIIDPDSGYATLGYNTSDNIKNGYKQIQPMFLEKDGELLPIQIPLDEFFHELRDISSDLVNKYPGLYYKAKK